MYFQLKYSALAVVALIAWFCTVGKSIEEFRGSKLSPNYKSLTATLSWIELLVAYNTLDIASKATYFQQFHPEMVVSDTAKSYSDGSIKMKLNIVFTNHPFYPSDKAVQIDGIDIPSYGSKLMWSGLFEYLHILRINFASQSYDMSLLRHQQPEEFSNFTAISIVNEMISLVTLRNRIAEFVVSPSYFATHINGLNERVKRLQDKIAAARRSSKKSLVTELTNELDREIYFTHAFFQEILLFVDYIQAIILNLCVSINVENTFAFNNWFTEDTAIKKGNEIAKLLVPLEAIIQREVEDCQASVLDSVDDCFFRAAGRLHRTVQEFLIPVCDTSVAQYEHEKITGETSSFSAIYHKKSYFNSSYYEDGNNLSTFLLDKEQKTAYTLSLCDIMRHENVHEKMHEKVHEKAHENRDRHMHRHSVTLVSTLYHYMKSTFVTLLRNEVKSNFQGCIEHYLGQVVTNKIDSLPRAVSHEDNELLKINSETAFNQSDSSSVVPSYDTLYSHVTYNLSISADELKSQVYSNISTNYFGSSFGAWHVTVRKGGTFFDVYYLNITSNDYDLLQGKRLVVKNQSNSAGEDISMSKEDLILLKSTNKVADDYSPTILFKYPRWNHPLLANKFYRIGIVENYGQIKDNYLFNSILHRIDGSWSLSGIYVNCTTTGETNGLESWQIEALANRNQDSNYFRLLHGDQDDLLYLPSIPKSCRIVHDFIKSQYQQVFLMNVLPLADFAIHPSENIFETGECRCLLFDDIHEYLQWLASSSSSSSTASSTGPFLPCPSILLVGLGGGNAHGFLQSHYPCANIISLEIYDAMVATAFKAMQLSDLVCQVASIENYFESLLSRFGITGTLSSFVFGDLDESIFETSTFLSQACKSKVVVGDGFVFIRYMSEVIAKLKNRIDIVSSSIEEHSSCLSNQTSSSSSCGAVDSNHVGKLKNKLGILVHLRRILSFDAVLFDVFDVNTVWSGQEGSGKGNGLFYHNVVNVTSNSTSSSTQDTASNSNAALDLLNNLDQLLESRHGLISFYLHRDSIYEKFKEIMMGKYGSKSVYEMQIYSNAGILAANPWINKRDEYSSRRQDGPAKRWWMNNGPCQNLSGYKDFIIQYSRNNRLGLNAIAAPIPTITC